MDLGQAELSTTNVATQQNDTISLNLLPHSLNPSINSFFFTSLLRTKLGRSISFIIDTTHGKALNNEEIVWSMSALVENVGFVGHSYGCHVL